MDPGSLIARVRQGTAERNKVMTELYRNEALRANTRKYVMHNSGTTDDADTVYNDVIIIFVKNCLKPDFNITSTLENYFFGVTKNLWRGTLGKRKKNKTTNHLPKLEDPENPEDLLIFAEKRTYLLELLSKIDDKCREVLILWAYKMKMKAIAEKMNYSSPEVVRKKKHLCLKKLRNLLDDDPEYWED